MTNNVALTLAGSGASRSEAIALGVDVGGTFTDAVLIAGGHAFTAKVPTTADQARAVMQAVSAVLNEAGESRDRVAHFAHGMTVATNALLEQRGARTALITTAGFEDVVEIARQSRPSLYRLCEARPAPLVPPELRFGARERTAGDGVIEALEKRAVADLVVEIQAANVQAVAICLLHSYAHPGHERSIEQALLASDPTLHVSTSSDLLPVFREYERTSTTVIDAYLSPLLRNYLGNLAEACERDGLPVPEIMQSNGGLTDVREAARHAAWTVLSGPAGGTAGAALSGLRSGDRELLSFDMGGTSCDVAVIEDGRVRQTTEREIDGRVIQLPMADIHTVGAGGGSIAWADAGGALRVGPRSAGAEPGPACYGRGGSEPTVTDANLVLGILGRESELAGGLRLDTNSAFAAIERLGRRLDLDAERAAAGIVRVANQEMLRALRVVTVERGIDPRTHTLVAFGGAGPMHAAQLADELEMERVICPPSAGVLSALGLAASDRRRDFARSVLLSRAALNRDTLAAEVQSLADKALATMPDAELEVVYHLRYRGQAFELPIEGTQSSTPEQLRDGFDQAHTARYGYEDPDATLELVNIGVRAFARRALPEIRAPESATPTCTQRSVWFGDQPVEADVWRGLPAAGERLVGPAVVELAEATAAVPPGWQADVEESGALLLTRHG